MGVGLDQLRQLEFYFNEALRQLQLGSSSPGRPLDRRFSQVEVAAALGKTPEYISKRRKHLIEEGALTAFSDADERAKRKDYTLAQLNELRRVFGALPSRELSDPCVRIAVQHFKGGVAKTSTAVGLSQYLATRGYRVLLMDMDFQGSATCAFGYVPDVDIKQDETIVPFYLGEQDSLAYATRQTHWPQLDLIPANMSMHNLEFAMARDLMSAERSQLGDLLTELSEGLDSIEEHYDVIIIDAPPHAGLVSLNILHAANALIIPTPPSMYDFASTKQFLQIVVEQMETVQQQPEYLFCKFLATKVMTNRSAQEDILNVMRQVAGDHMLKEIFHHTTEVEKASLDFRSVYEERKPQGRAKTILDNVFGEIELEIVKCWPSRREEITEKRRVYT